MATPAEHAKPAEPQPAKASKKAKPGPAGKPVKAEKIRPKTARQHAVEFLKAHGGKAKFSELVGHVSKKMGGKLTWTPTYYLKSPGFHSGVKGGVERGTVTYSESEEKKGREVIVQARRERMAGMRKSKGKGKKAGKKSKAEPAPKAGKKETILSRRERTAAELKAKKEASEAGAKAEFDAAVEANNKKA